MEQLLELARKKCDQAEIYSTEYVSDSASFRNAQLHDIDTDFLSGITLRIIKDGKLGFAYTRNLNDREQVLANALHSIDGGVEAPYEFPATAGLAALNTCDDAVSALPGKSLVDEASRVCQRLASGTGGEISSAAFTYREELRVLNTRGADLRCQTTACGVYGNAGYPGAGTGVLRYDTAKGFRPMPDALLDELIRFYQAGEAVAEPKGGRMKVLFMPQSLICLLWRISSGTSSRSVYEKVSPIADKLGVKVFDSQLTITDDATDDRYPGARSFDDEGTASRPLTLVENGVLRTFYYDLNYGKKLGMPSTGHGYKTGQWGGDPVTLKPGPALTHGFIKPGKSTLDELVKQIDRGIILEGVLGAHSGNIPNGDYSVGVSPALYVEGGEIRGRVKDAMVAGNIYETLKNVAAVGDTPSPSFGGFWAPPILCYDVSVATKG